MGDNNIYIDSEGEHERHVKRNMQRLLEAELYLKSKKREFLKDTVKYLALIILTKGISMDKDEVETIRNWSRAKKTANGTLNNLLKYNNSMDFAIIIKGFFVSIQRKWSHWED